MSRLLNLAAWSLFVAGGTPLLLSTASVLAQDEVSEPQTTAADPSDLNAMPTDSAVRGRDGVEGVAPNAPPEFPKFDEVAKDYTKVVSTSDGEPSLYTLHVRSKDGQMLAELPRNFESQKLLIAYTIAGGTITSGVQLGDTFAYWKRYDKQLALIEPNIGVRSSGDAESTRGRNRVFTDRVILSVPIACLGPNGGPVIDMDALLVGQSGNFFGGMVRGANTSLATIRKAKAFPRNVEVGYELPLQGGRLGTIYYSISVLPENTGYQSRKADLRVGYFTTVHRDLGNAAADTPWVRFINRWKLEKADPKLRTSPPKEPIVFYLENTIPVRYRRWVRDGVLEWNKAFEKVGITSAVEVYQQDAATNAHMDKDPEDARYNFVMWTNAGMGFAIGPSRVDPRTGQILDADIVMDEGFITSWVNAWKKIIPEIAMQNFGPETFAWLAQNPDWDPRVRLAWPNEREQVMREVAAEHARMMADATNGVPHALIGVGSEHSHGLPGDHMHPNLSCMASMTKSLDIALFRLGPDLFTELAAQSTTDDEEGEGEKSDAKEVERGKRRPKSEAEPSDLLDGVPEWFIGPALKDVIMHEVGHTLGLRHNFKASSIYTMKDINSEAIKGNAHTGSVMDYNPLNINMGDGPIQGDYTMVTIGPYDYWAIEYGYSFENDLKPILQKVSNEQLPFGTDEDARGPDPHTRVFDFSANSLDYADSQMRLVKDLRSKILDRMVKEGDSWAKARQGYEILLGRHFSAVGIASGWIGGAHVVRDHKGDPGDRNPVTPVSVEDQRRALTFIINNVFKDEAFGLTSDLLAKMTVDKWYDEGGMWDLGQDPTWPVHDRIMGLQAATLTMVLNPTTLNRVFDNEYRVSGDADALTVPEVLFSVSDAIWTELDQPMNGTYSPRKPMISSLRRNLQREHLDRLISLSMPSANGGFGAAGKPIANLCVFKLRDLSAKIDKIAKGSGAKIDAYSLAHLSEAKVRIDKALDAQYIYNTNDIRSGGAMPFMFFGESPKDR